MDTYDIQHAAWNTNVKQRTHHEHSKHTGKYFIFALQDLTKHLAQKMQARSVFMQQLPNPSLVVPAGIIAAVICLYSTANPKQDVVLVSKIAKIFIATWRFCRSFGCKKTVEDRSSWTFEHWWRELNMKKLSTEDGKQDLLNGVFKPSMNFKYWNYAPKKKKKIKKIIA